MTVTRIRRSRADEAGRLFEIWRTAVAATHHFLPADEAEVIAQSVRDDYLPGALLWVAEDAGGRPLGFMGMTGNSVDSLFVDPACHGRGIGRALIEHARGSAGGPLKVDVNEQNPGGVVFIFAWGFGSPAGRTRIRRGVRFRSSTWPGDPPAGGEEEFRLVDIAPRRRELRGDETQHNHKHDPDRIVGRDRAPGAGPRRPLARPHRDGRRSRP